MKKIGVLALVLVFAFGALGIGYAHWSQTLYVEGTVKTFAPGCTLPAHVISYGLSDLTGELKFEWTTPPPASPAYGFFWKDFDGDGVYDPPDPAVDDPGELIISVKLVNLVCEQLDPCSEEKGELDLHVEQAAEQGHTYNVLATIEAVQWNAP